MFAVTLRMGDFGRDGRYVLALQEYRLYKDIGLDRLRVNVNDGEGDL